MKKLYILIASIFVFTSGFAQRSANVAPQPIRVAYMNNYAGSSKTTATGDVDTLTHVTATDTLTCYKLATANGGYVTGTNIWGDRAFAERYDFTDNGGKNMQVVGLFAVFTGKVNPTSGKTITFKLWDEESMQMISTSRYFRGFPNNVIDTLTVPVTKLGIGTTADTLKKFMFQYPTDNYYSSFFAGYSIDYDFASLNGDTIGLASTYNGHRLPLLDYRLVYNTSSFDTTLDTIYNVQNATLESDNKWYDNYSQNNSIKNNLAIYPIVVLGYPAAVKGVTRNNFTFYGNYPNPATNSTNIKFSLAKNTDVTVQLMDMAGRVLNNIKTENLSAGEHTIPVNTADLAVGEYLYLIRTAEGEGIASKFSKE